MDLFLEITELNWFCRQHADTADKNDQDATEDTWTFDGRAFHKKNEKMKTLLESKGGPNLVRHYTGACTCDIIQAKIFEIAPIEGWETEAGMGELGGGRRAPCLDGVLRGLHPGQEEHRGAAQVPAAIFCQDHW